MRSFLATHPALSIDLKLNDAFVDLIAEGVDVAVRIGELADSRLVSTAHQSFVRGRQLPKITDKLGAGGDRRRAALLEGAGRDREILRDGKFRHPRISDEEILIIGLRSIARLLEFIRVMMARVEEYKRLDPASRRGD